MLMTKLPCAEIEVVEGCIEASLASDFQAEMFDYLPDIERQKLFGRTEGCAPEFLQLGGMCLFNCNKYPATRRLVRTLGIIVCMESDLAVSVNYQPPKVAQEFHRDSPFIRGRVIIVHGGDMGAFDYAPNARTVEEAEASHETISLNAGDIVMYNLPHVFHRGRNTGDIPRVTMALSTVLA
jgi:hypothetical protein